MADLTLTDGAYRALLIPDPRFTLDALDRRVHGDARRRPRRVPEPVRPTRAILEATESKRTPRSPSPPRAAGMLVSGAAPPSPGRAPGSPADRLGRADGDQRSGPRRRDRADLRATSPRRRRARPSRRADRRRLQPAGGATMTRPRRGRALLRAPAGRRRRWIALRDDLWQPQLPLPSPGMTPAQEVRLYVLWRDVTVGGQEQGRLSLYVRRRGRGVVDPDARGLPHDAPRLERRDDGLHGDGDLARLRR